MKNKVVIIIGSQAENESFARMAAAAYIAALIRRLKKSLR